MVPAVPRRMEGRLTLFVILLRGIPKSPRSTDVLGPYRSGRTALKDAGYMTDPKRNRLPWRHAEVCEVTTPIAQFEAGVMYAAGKGNLR